MVPSVGVKEGVLLEVAGGEVGGGAIPEQEQTVGPRGVTDSATDSTQNLSSP